MKKKFYCAETREYLTIESSKSKSKIMEFNDIQDMSVEELEKIINYCNERTLRQVFSSMIKDYNKRGKVVKIAQAIQNRTYHVVNGTHDKTWN